MAHNQPTHRDILSLLVGAWVHFARSLASGTALVCLGVASWLQDTSWLWAALVCALCWLFLAFYHAGECGKARCAVCTGPLLKRSRNVKHVGARRFLGSYELANALRVILTVSYRCQHCGTHVYCHRQTKEKARNRGALGGAYRHQLPSSQASSSPTGVILHGRTKLPPRRTATGDASQSGGFPPQS